MTRHRDTAGPLRRNDAVPLEATIARGMTRSYLLALVLFVLAMVAIVPLLEGTVSQGRDGVARLNLVGRIDHDTLRALVLARSAAAGDPQAADAFAVSVDRIGQLSRVLLDGGAMGLAAPLGPGFRSLPFRDAPGFADGLEGFVGQAQALAERLREAPEIDAAARLAARYDLALKPALDNLGRALAIAATQDMAEMSRRHRVALLLVLLLLVAEGAIIFRPAVLRARRRVAALEDMARRDSLTGLPNRRALLEAVERQGRLDRREGQPSALLMIDFDRFKQLNDGHGHDAGDAALRRFAAIAAETLRTTDTIGRIGGEEFAVLLPGVDGGQAVAVAEKLRQAVAEDRLVSSPRVTVSIGITTLVQGETVEETLRRADRGLYRAKAAGRNRVTLADPVPAVTPAALHAVPRWRHRLNRAAARAEAR